MQKIIITMFLMFFVLFSGCASADKYTDESQKNFLDSCIVASFGEEEACKCMWEKIKAEYSFSKFIEIEQSIREGRVDPEFNEFSTGAIFECLENKKQEEPKLKENNLPEIKIEENYFVDFVGQCHLFSGGNDDVCICLIEKIQEKYSDEEMEELEKMIQTESTPEEFNEFAKKMLFDCIESFKKRK